MPKPPSLLWRVLSSVVLLVGFYVMTIVVSAVLLVAPFGVFYGDHLSGLNLVVAFACGWIPAALLLKGALGVRRPKFTPPSNPVDRAQAPELLAVIDELAASAQTAAPTAVYLSPAPNVGVTETGGILGLGSRRVLLLGVPILECLTVQELRAVLAHELGHYIGGDTRLCGVLAYTEASFHSVLESVKAEPGDAGHFAIRAGLDLAEKIGGALVGAYVRLYLRATRPANRRQEIAADALAARLCGREAAIRALEKIAVFAPVYQAYVSGDVALAVHHKVIPSDILGGFRAFRSRIRERGNEETLVEMLRTEKTDPFDSHPALTERTRALSSAPEGAVQDDARSALDLFSDPGALEGWLARATSEALEGPVIVRATRLLKWSKIPSKVLSPAIRKAADELGSELREIHAEPTSTASMFGAVARAVGSGGGASMACRLEPQLSHAMPQVQAALGALIVENVLRGLFQGALLERGATLDLSLGEPCHVFRWRDERIEVGEIVARSMNDAAAAAELIAWAERLEAAEAEMSRSEPSAEL